MGAEGEQRGKCIGRRSPINQHPQLRRDTGMSKYQHPEGARIRSVSGFGVGNFFNGFSLQFTQKISHAHLHFLTRFAPGRSHVHPVVIPLAQTLIANRIERLHLPLAKVHLHEARVGSGVDISAGRSQHCAAPQRRGKHRIVDSVKLLQFPQRLRRIGLKAGIGQQICAPIACAGRHIGARVAHEGYFYRAR